MIYGIDIGGTKMEIAVFDPDLQLVDRWRIATPQDSYDSFISAIAGLIEQADGRFGETAPVGLGIPGLIDAKGRSLSANVPAATGRAVASDVARLVGRQVVAENDCRCFALSEAHGGAGAGQPIVFGAILGTGAAGGLVVDGRLVRGRQGIAGEYGHIQLSAELAMRYGLPLLRCGCGLPSCFESYIAGPGLLRMAKRFGSDVEDVRALAELWRAGDKAAVRTRDCFVDLLGAVFASVAVMTDPDVIVMGGGLSLLDDIIEALPAAIERHLFAGFHAPTVVQARFGDASGARGAAILALQASQ